MTIIKNICLSVTDVVKFFIPRFITEYVAVAECEDGSLFTLCPLNQIQSGDKVVGKIKVKSIAWLGMGLLPKSDGELEEL